MNNFSFLRVHTVFRNITNVALRYQSQKQICCLLHIRPPCFGAFRQVNPTARRCPFSFISDGLILPSFTTCYTFIFLYFLHLRDSSFVLQVFQFILAPNPLLVPRRLDQRSLAPPSWLPFVNIDPSVKFLRVYPPLFFYSISSLGISLSFPLVSGLLSGRFVPSLEGLLPLFSY